MIPKLKEFEVREEFDTLSLYHHRNCDFEYQLQLLLSILEFPKEYNLMQRFNKIATILNKPFCIELLARLNLLKGRADEADTTENHHSNPMLLLHFWALLECSDSIEAIANYLELTPEEVQELIRELHHTFSIESLLQRIREYYSNNKHHHDLAEYQLQQEHLGVETSFEPKDTIEERKQRLRRRYGHIANFYELTP